MYLTVTFVQGKKIPRVKTAKRGPSNAPLMELMMDTIVPPSVCTENATKAVKNPSSTPRKKNKNLRYGQNLVKNIVFIMRKEHFDSFFTSDLANEYFFSVTQLWFPRYHEIFQNKCTQ